jgi:hypothetical protein
LVASTSTTAASALEAAVTMLRVYCSWPGASPMMNLRCFGAEVAVGHVDGDALFALGAQAVGEQGQIGFAWRCTPARWSCNTDLEFHQQTADEGAFAVVNRAAGDDSVAERGGWRVRVVARSFQK